MSLVTNYTTSPGLANTQMAKWYDRRLLENMKPKLVHYEYGQRRALPKHNGKTVSFRKFTPFQAVTGAMGEGVIPDGQALAMTEVTATVNQYGDYVRTTDVLDMTSVDPIVDETVVLISDQAALSIDHITRDVLHQGTYVQYANNTTSRATVKKTDILTTVELRKAARWLRKNKAPMFKRGGQEFYVAIVSPDAVYDLQSDATWRTVSMYSDKEQVFSGEIGRLFGIVVIQTTEAPIHIGAGASSANVASALVFGQNAYGVIELDGRNTQTIVKPMGSAGTADPLNQFATIGWKVMGYAAKILQPSWLIRIEHGVTD